MDWKSKEKQPCNIEYYIWEGSAWWILYQCLALIVVLVGLVSNAFIIILMHFVRSHLRAHTCLLYSVAIVDALILVNYLFQRANEIYVFRNGKSGNPTASSAQTTYLNNQTQTSINYSTSWNINNSHNSHANYYVTASLFNSVSASGCKLYHFFIDVLYSMASWLIALLSIERFNVIFFPFRNHLCNKTHEALFFIAICFVASSISSLYIPLMMTKNNGVCVASIDYEIIYSKVNTYWSTTTMQYLLPAIIIFVCNGLVLLRMHSIMGDVQRNDGGHSAVLHGLRSHKSRKNHSQDRISKNKRRVTIILLIISTSYAILHLPLIIFVLYVNRRMMQQENNNSTLSNYCNEEKSYYAALELQSGPMVPYAGLISNISYAINFFVYIIWGKRYRAEISRLLSSSRTTNASLAGGGNVGHLGTGRLQIGTPGASYQEGALANNFAMQELK